MNSASRTPPYIFILYIGFPSISQQVVMVSRRDFMGQPFYKNLLFTSQNWLFGNKTMKVLTHPIYKALNEKNSTKTHQRTTIQNWINGFNPFVLTFYAKLDKNNDNNLKMNSFRLLIIQNQTSNLSNCAGGGLNSLPHMWRHPRSLCYP